MKQRREKENERLEGGQTDHFSWLLQWSVAAAAMLSMLHSKTHTLDYTNTVMSLKQRWTACRENIVGLQRTNHTQTHTHRGEGGREKQVRRWKEKERGQEEVREGGSVLTDEQPGCNFLHLKPCQ